MDLKQLLAESLLASASDAIVVSDREGVIRVWNPGAERIFGHAAAEALGQSLDLIIPPNLRPRHWDGYRHVMETGRSQYDAGALRAGAPQGWRADFARIHHRAADIRERTG
jgi:PAS domain S-box-containing protein